MDGIFSLISPTITALSFEGNQVKVVGRRRNEISIWSSLELTEEEMSQGQVHQPQAVGAKLDELLQETGASRRRIVSCVTGHRSLHRVLTIPKVKKRLMEETIKRKAKQEFAIPLEQTDLSWHLLSQDDDAIQIYILAIPNALIDFQLQALKTGKMRLKSLDAKPLALVRAANRQECVIADLESYSMTVIIVREGVPLIVRTVPLEAETLTEEAKVELLIQELARTTKFFDESNKKARLSEDTPVITCGGMLAEPEVRQRLSDRVGYPVMGPEPPMPLPEDFPVSEYAVNLGLLLKKLR